MRVDIIAGARPNFMKIAPIIEAIKGIRNISFRLIHTGQHFDHEMSGSFFEELDIPLPDINLGAGGGTQAEQTAAIMVGYERIVQETPADVCLVVGDVTSTMACAIVAKKAGMLVVHVEGGIRSFDLSMPEEINRMVTDSITDYFYTTSAVANNNLRKLGIREDRIIFVGNTMIDTLLKNRNRFKKPSCFDTIGLSLKKYAILTLHRPKNVDGEKQLANMLQAICRSLQDIPVVFPVHPRTAKILEKLELDLPNLNLVSPLGYLEFNYLVRDALLVLTDSGGITEETTVLGVPCLTLRDNTERPETVEIGTNMLVGTDPQNIRPAVEHVLKGSWKKGSIPELWDGKAAERIVAHLAGLK